MAHLFRVLLLCAVLGCAQKAPGPVPPAADPPVVLVTPEAFAKEARTDRDAFRAKYQGKRIELTGTVCFKRVPVGEAFLYGHKEDDKEPFGQLIVFAPLAKDQNRLRALVQGQRVTVRGRQTDAGYPALVECEMVDVGPSPVIPVTVTALANEFQTDREAALKKFAGKSVVMRAKVQSTKTTGNTLKKLHWTVTDPVGGAAVVDAFTEDTSREAFTRQLEGIRVGDVIVLIGEPNGSSLVDAVVLDEPPPGVKLPNE
ncbi:MAG TPA: hypothetical protein VGE74_01195 [Gemmata sp.]